jgi:hypothetical protein
MRQIEVDCNCGRMVPVEGIETTLSNEDFTPVKVTCKCGEQYEVSLRMSILGKVPRRLLRPE